MANRLTPLAKRAWRGACAVLEGAGEISGRGEANAGTYHVDGRFCFGQQFARLKNPAILQKIYRRPATGLPATPGQMGGGDS